MDTVDVFVVRIYRRFPDDPEHVEGIVETPGNHETFPFRMRDELVRLIFPDPSAPKKRKPRSKPIDGSREKK